MCVTKWTATPTKLPREVEKIARSIATECYGLDFQQQPPM